MMKPSLTLLALAVAGAASVVGACTVTTTTNNNGTGDDGGLDATAGDDDGAVGNDASDSGLAAETATDAGTDGDAAVEAAPPPMASIRLANWSPDSPAAGYDFCVAPHGTTNWTGPLLGVELADAGTIGDGGANSLAFPLVSAYFDISPGTYDVELVAAGSASCATAIATANALPALAASSFTTFAAIGDTSMAGSDPALKIVGLADDSTAVAGSALVRFVNAAPDLASVDVGTGTLASTNFQALFTNVQFGQAGAAAGSDAGTVDPNGYLSIAPLSAAQLSVHTSAGGTSDTATASNVTVTSGGIATLALVNGKNGGPGPQFLLCQDDPSSTTLLSQCSIVSP